MRYPIESLKGYIWVPTSLIPTLNPKPETLNPTKNPGVKGLSVRLGRGLQVFGEVLRGSRHAPPRVGLGFRV